MFKETSDDLTGNIISNRSPLMTNLCCYLFQVEVIMWPTLYTSYISYLGVIGQTTHVRWIFQTYLKMIMTDVADLPKYCFSTSDDLTDNCGHLTNYSNGQLYLQKLCDFLPFFDISLNIDYSKSHTLNQCFITLKLI